jgi:serine protease Do
MFIKKIALALLLCSISVIVVYGQNIKQTKKLESSIAKVVANDLPACVKISAYDTLIKRASNVRFSGVVVSADGYILTAAHAEQPNQIYQVTFPDGKKRFAKGLGRISVGGEWIKVDPAMIKITGEETVPFVKMGWSSELKDGQPCIGISYPGTFEQKLPNIRLGRLANVHFSEGNFESTCKMEPGDSGGPLFDAEGRLIGLHSWVKPNEEQNYEVPIDLYRKYWDILKEPESYSRLPDAPKLKLIVSNDIIPTIPPIQQLAGVSAKQSKTVVQVNSTLNGQLSSISGTIIAYHNNKKTINCIVSKSSMVGNKVTIKIDGKDIPAKVVGRDKSNDLVILDVNTNLPNGINASAKMLQQDTNKQQVGKVLISPLQSAETRVGIVSTKRITMEMKYSVGYFGANADFIGNTITITQIPEGSPAATVLKLYDQIVGINNVPVSQPYQYGAEFNKYYQGDTISIDAVRDGKKIHLNVRLGVYAASKHAAEGYQGGRSIRSDGFKTVFAQDAAIRAEDCGGPVFDVDGEFCGINIARHSRTSTVVMPADVISMVLAQLFTRS